jgi:beta-N-acetylhexosaminidase
MDAERLMLGFAGTELPGKTARLLSSHPIAGVTLFRHHNVAAAAQVRALTDRLQAAAHPAAQPLLVATDQEGGQLIALGPDTTQFAGAMALGAAGDERLAEQVARAMAREMRALGVNVNYAPVCDLATNPANPALGIRSFGDDPVAAAGLAAATVRGLQGEGVAATAKHFPGAGEAGVDTHHELAIVTIDRAQLEERELVPFRAALAAGARLVMAGHFAVPALTGDAALPASLASPVLHGLLRDGLGFDGLVITDALDMAGVAAGGARTAEVVAAIAAGEDLLLGTVDEELQARMLAGLAEAASGGSIEPLARHALARRLADLRGWLGGYEQPALSVVGCTDPRVLAQELAARSITLVRDDDGLLPLAGRPSTRVLVVHSRPADLTPADTSSGVVPGLAAALRRRLPATDELLLPVSPATTDLTVVRDRAADYDVVVVGTFAAHLQPAQAELARAVLGAGRPTATVALRTPWDLPTYPGAGSHVCTYGILPPTIEALAAALVGEVPFRGRLPVDMAPLYHRGHGLVATRVLGDA